jgi:hypothetical protein
MRSLLPVTLALVLFAAACGGVIERAMAPDEEERAALAARCVGFRSVLDVVESALDPIPTLRDLMYEPDPTAWDAMIALAVREEQQGLERAELRIERSEARESPSHQRAYDALEQSVALYLDINQRSQLGETRALLLSDVRRANAQLYEAARQHEASCGPPAGIALTG